MFRSRHYIVCRLTVVNILHNTFHFFSLFPVILAYCLNVVSSCLYIIPLFYKNQVQFNQFQKNPLWFLSPKRIFLFLSIFHYFSLFFRSFSSICEQSPDIQEVQSGLEAPLNHLTYLPYPIPDLLSMWIR